MAAKPGVGIGIDQGLPQGEDLKKIDNGKYFYKLDNGKFDVDKFNRDFDQYKDQRKAEMQVQIQKRLAELNKKAPDIPAYNLSIGQTIINIKDSMVNILDDLLQFKFNYETFSKQNRMYYLGLMFVIIGLIFFLYYSLTDCEKVEEPQSNILEIKHLHRIINGGTLTPTISSCDF